MSYCSSCAKDVGAVAQLSDSGQIVQSCPVCQNMIGGGALSQPLAATGTAIGGEATQTIRLMPKPAQNVVTLPYLERRVQSAFAQSNEPIVSPQGDVIGMIRARLAYLDAEIAKRAGLETEAKKLRKMLTAADRMNLTNEG